MFDFDYMTLLYAIPVVLISLSFHETAHAYVSYRLGDPTAKRMGRLTLNPLKHLDLLGTIMMIISMRTGMGFGWAKPVPINPSYYNNYKRGTMITSLAGPVSNLLLAFISAFPLLFLMYSYDVTSLGQYDSRMIIYTFFKMFFLSNLNLAIFNLLPVPPLDGSKILGGLLPNKLYIKQMQYERYIGLVFIAIVIILPDQFSQVLSFITVPAGNALLKIANPVVSLFFSK